VKRDVQATEAAHFQDPRSYVAKDGREVLYKEDWEARKDELRMRSGGKCEAMLLFGRCMNWAAHPDHIIKRSKARDDRMSNLQALCIGCHRAKHPEKEPRWTKRSQS